uniref:SUMO-activating enzyme subunit n=1 Tax=Globisporangium ultimum (strain ATCC 200006 / CBS 805.95 / DAOM BR144) TaxID=431595 RepID=K3WJR7_GLOUD
MAHPLAATLGVELRDKVQNSKILVVGAGGIGCELVKNLVLSGFVNIHLIDLDTIDVSNLNRQFLFRSHHVGQPKALVAKEVALSFNPKAQITAHHGNIKSAQFGIDYFEQFALVLNALDNVDARKHVNRLCLATNTPLIESGTTGYLGQVSVIKKGETECYECTEKVTQKVYPICTIRSTPDKMVHCIVWAKECYKLLFGKTEDSMLWEDQSGEEKSAFMDLITRPDDMAFDPTSLLPYAQNVFRGLFEFEIKKKLEMKVYKTASKTPQPLVLEEIMGSKMVEAIKLDGIISQEQAKAWNDRDVWSVAECTKRFFACIVKILQSEEARAHLGSYEFDKDDAVAMEFVTAAANLRAAVFTITMESLYSCKGIAGNIIPAIATTNAIVAGIQVLEAFKILRAAKPIGETCSYTYCNRSWDSRGVLLNPVALSKPNPKCYVCSKHMLELVIDTNKTYLRDLVDKVLKKKLGVNEPTISIGSSTIYEEGEDAEESLVVNLNKLLVNLPGKGISHDTVISIEDFSQDFRCSIRVLHKDEAGFGEDATEFFALGGEIQQLNAASTSNEDTKGGDDDDGDDDDDFEIVGDTSVERASPGKKRARSESDDDVEVIAPSEAIAKRSKAN